MVARVGQLPAAALHLGTHCKGLLQQEQHPNSPSSWKPMIEVLAGLHWPWA